MPPPERPVFLFEEGGATDVHSWFDCGMKTDCWTFENQQSAMQHFAA
jgi:hypothetical protein